MVQQDTPGSSDVPKRSFFRSIGKKKFIYIVLPLLLVNAGIAHLITKQVAIRAGAETRVLDESASLPEADEVSSDSAQEETIEEDTTPVITTYKVKSGDTLSGIAEKFNISVNTIRWANDLTEKTSKITIGDELVILPVSGVEYTVKKGDTLSGIAAKFDASQDDILKYNDIEAAKIKVGTELIIPGAEPVVPKAPAKKVVTTPKVAPAKTSEKVATPTTTTPVKVEEKKETTATSSSYATPVHGILTQGRHDATAVDFGVPTGTIVSSFKDGTVIVAKSSGYNGGYGSYIVINHEGSCQTQYSHLSSVKVSVGDKVSMGETIGLSGNTGRSTGPHLHFNVNNCGGNPFFKYKVGTKF
jgi:murein DD-endopeptidase MepM/ murein hydrolase activator NlpD